MVFCRVKIYHISTRSALKAFISKRLSLDEFDSGSAFSRSVATDWTNITTILRLLSKINFWMLMDVVEIIVIQCISLPRTFGVGATEKEIL